MREIRQKARERIKSHCKVCPVCDGRACAGQVPGIGGIGTGASFQNNVSAFLRHRLAMRVLHSANNPLTGCTLWGRELTLPVLAAPIGSVKNNLGSDLSEGEYTAMLLEGCIKAGTLAGIGDTAKPETYQQGLDQIGDRGRHVIPYIKPWALEEVAKRMDMLLAAGCSICGMDVDAAGLVLLRRLAAPVATRSPQELAAIIRQAHDRKLKFIVKGIMTVDEARLAVDAGADAVLVSNHGGRVLDHTPGTVEVLPAIADAVGQATVVMVDGGVRSGVDVLKALALGARVALICRPVAVAAHGGGADGVARYFEVIRDELSQAMRLTGCADLNAVGGHVLC
jgi:hypothetical protein